MNIFERAAEHYGVTENLMVVGYILPDGRMLDFEGGPGGGYSRGLDHRDVAWLFDGVESTDAMIKFIRAGAIRIMVTGRWSDYWAFIDVAKLPTAQQWERLTEIVRGASSGVFEITPPKGEGYSKQNSKEWTGGISMFNLREFAEGELSPAATTAQKKVAKQAAKDRDIHEKVRGLAQWGWKGARTANEVRKALKLPPSALPAVKAELDWEIEVEFRVRAGSTLRFSDHGYYWG